MRYCHISILALCAVVGPSTCYSQNTTEKYHFVSNTRPPDEFLSLRSQPSLSSGERIATMRNGTLLEVVKRSPDGWWYVRIANTRQEGWALSGQGRVKWIVCCFANATPL